MNLNVLLVILDSVRAKNTSIHGYINDTTPTLNELAKTATVYEQARAPGIWSLPSHASIFTGKSVEEHKLTTIDKTLRAKSTIFEKLREEGYETGVFSGNPFITEVDVGMTRGFETVYGNQHLLFRDGLHPDAVELNDGESRYVQFLRASLKHDKPVKSILNGVGEKIAIDYPWLVPKHMKAISGEQYAKAALDWIGSTTGPWGACINLMDAHTPYHPNEEYDKWGGKKVRRLQNEIDGGAVWEFQGGQRPWWQRKALESLYDGGIREADAAVGSVLDGLRNRGEFEDTLVVVTSDHGEGFAEPSRIRPGTRLTEHVSGIHECLLHVPLVVKFPRQTVQETIEAPASLTEFPRVVRKVNEAAWIGDEFVPEGRMVATSHGLRERNAKIASKYCDDLSSFRGVGHAVYEKSEAGVRKHVSWNDHSTTVEIFDAHTAREVGGYRPGERIASAIDSLGNVSLTETEQGSELDKQTEKHLEELGYL